MKLMHHLDYTSIKGFALTIFCGLFTFVTKADVALFFTIAAAVSTIIYNVVKIRKEIK